MLAHGLPAAYRSAADSCMATCLTVVACSLRILQLAVVKSTVAWSCVLLLCLVCDAQQCLLPCLLITVNIYA